MPIPPKIQRVFFKSPLGNLVIEGDQKTVSKISFAKKNIPQTKSTPRGALQKTIHWLENYFELKTQKPFPWKLIDLSQRTPFQKKVLKELWKIPYGRLENYKGLALRAGSPHAARAVGSVMKGNPVPLIIPCHRIIASDGSLGGFSPGVSIKKRLLELEGSG